MNNNDTTRVLCDHFACLGQWCLTPGEIGETVAEGAARIKREERNRAAREKRAWVKEQTRLMKEKEQEEKIEAAWEELADVLQEQRRKEEVELKAAEDAEGVSLESAKRSAEEYENSVNPVVKFANKKKWVHVVYYWHGYDLVQWEEGNVWYIPKTNTFIAYFDDGDERTDYGDYFKGEKSMVQLNLKEAEEYLKQNYNKKRYTHRNKAINELRKIYKN